MAINIDDTIRRKAIKILEDEQTELVGAYDKQAVRGVSPGMESDFIPETSELAQGRTEKRIVKDSKGRYSEKKVFVEQRFHDEALVDEKETRFKEDAETLQEVCRAYDNEIIRLNNKIDAKKLQIVQESTAAIALGCSTASVGIATTSLLTFNEEAEFVKIYTKMAGPGYDPGVDNPFEPDATVQLNESYAGFGYQNVRENKEILIGAGSVGSGATTGIRTDGSGSFIGNVSLMNSTLIAHSNAGAGANASSCHTARDNISAAYNEIIALRKERDSYRNKLNIIKKKKSDKELSHWGYQNTKNEVNVRRNQNASVIDAINELDGTDPIQEPGLVLHFDATNNSSYFGSGNTWYDISNDDYDDNGTFSRPTYSGTQPVFVEDEFDSDHNYFFFDGTHITSANCTHVDFEIDKTHFGDPKTVTVEMLVQLTRESGNSDDMMFGWFNYGIWLKSIGDDKPALGFSLPGSNNVAQSLYGLSREKVEELSLLNDKPLAEREFDAYPANWNHYVFVMNRFKAKTQGDTDVNAQLFENKIYINGVEQELEEIIPVTSPQSANARRGMAFAVDRVGSDFEVINNHNPGSSWDAEHSYNDPIHGNATAVIAGRIASRRVGRDTSDMESTTQTIAGMNVTTSGTLSKAINLAEMEVSMVRIYNKELTQAEITANYDEVKGRFGLI
tara:strand:+ start:87 stop:2111 length:2025 start_codon:yes stop_codon:yes gene_type:complete